MKKISLIFIFFVFIFLLCGCQNKSMRKESRVMMGTFVEVISSDRRAADIVFDEIKRIEGLLSRYKPESEIAKINTKGRIKASTDTFYTMRKAKEFWLLSDGAFDVTIGPLMNIWGFTDKKYRIPDAQEVDATLKLVGFNKVVLDDSLNIIEFKDSDMKLDLGAIAKGYAVDCAVRRLKQEGINSCLINAGGDIYCLGDKSGQPWVVAVQDPRGEDLVEYLQLKDKAVATSGDYQQFFVKGAKRYSHIVNPKTGYPADMGVVSVTVIAPDCLTADALATTVFVLGKEKGHELAKKIPGVTIRVIEEKDVPYNQ